MNAKVRKAQMQKIPYMLIIGDREVEEDTVSVRLRSGETINSSPIDGLRSRILEEIENKL